MESSAIAYYKSLMAVVKPLGINLQEIVDWNCCGATEYVGISLTPAYALITRNLALAQQQANHTNTLIAPCSACYLNLAKADHFMQERPSLGVKVNTALAAGNLHYDPGKLQIRHLLDVMVYDIGLDTIRSKVVRPLTGLRLAPYVGCMLPRPDYEHRWSDTEYPTELDRVLKALGAEVIDYPLKTHCCGGHMTQIGPSTAFELIRRLVHAADEYKADMMVTLCPMCQMNLDAYQGEMNRFFHTNYAMPIMFFTQLIGLAFGFEPKELGFGSELVSAASALKRIGVEPPPDEPKQPKKPAKKTGLPMPQMPGQAEEVSS
jgi:heterodisulfide reductase subunit B